ncbi:hypothetical protein Esti_001878 [Eimeria stiedai]
MIWGFTAAAARRTAAPQSCLLQHTHRCLICRQVVPRAAAAATAAGTTAAAATAAAVVAAVTGSKCLRSPRRRSSLRARLCSVAAEPPLQQQQQQQQQQHQQQQQQQQRHQRRGLTQWLTWSHGAVLTAKGEGRMAPLYLDALCASPHTSSSSSSKSCSRRFCSSDVPQVMIPHPSKRDRGGEDAACLVVADGVGGWESSGIDAGIYSKELVKRCASLPLEAQQQQQQQQRQQQQERLACVSPCCACCSISVAVAEAEGESAMSPVDIMKRAYLATHAIGSSPSKRSVIARSDFQCHAFNFPLQLGTGSKDLPEDAHVLSLAVEPGDVVLLATDGVWDNVFDHQVLKSLQAESDPQKLAEAVARLSFSLSQSPKWCSPFAARERELLGLAPRHVGGKPDDISVVVGVWRRRGEGEERGTAYPEVDAPFVLLLAAEREPRRHAEASNEAEHSSAHKCARGPCSSSSEKQQQQGLQQRTQPLEHHTSLRHVYTPQPQQQQQEERQQQHQQQVEVLDVG